MSQLCSSWPDHPISTSCPAAVDMRPAGVLRPAVDCQIAAKQLVVPSCTATGRPQTDQLTSRKHGLQTVSDRLCSHLCASSSSSAPVTYQGNGVPLQEPEERPSPPSQSASSPTKPPPEYLKASIKVPINHSSPSAPNTLSAGDSRSHPPAGDRSGWWWIERCQQDVTKRAQGC